MSDSHQPFGAKPPTHAGGAPPEDPLDVLVGDPEIAQLFIAEALDHLGSIEACVLQLEERPNDSRLLDDVFRPFHTIKGNAGALGLVRVQEVAHKVETLLDLARAGKYRLGARDIDIVLTAVDLLTAMIDAIAARLAGRTVADSYGREVAVMAALDRMVSGDAAESRGAEGDTAAVEPSGDGAGRATGSAVDAHSAVKVDTRKLDGLVDTVGELMIVQTIILQDAALQSVAGDERLARHLAQLRRLTSDLQRSAMSLRLVPIRRTFQKTARLVRDLGRKSGKPIDLVMSGEDTELDRKVVEEIGDPLIHMVRNSVDHGIEDPARRLAVGKPAQATLSLSACHQAGNIVIAVSDDGAGLNTERIRAKAVANGLLAAEADVSAADIHQMIFHPGFSTAERVTELSGRGVGMDVVRRNVEALRGRIEVQSFPGKGATFVLKLPLTLAIVDGLLLQVGLERFVLPTFAVRESLRPRRDQVHGVHERHALIQVRDSLLPLVHLADLFNMPGAKRDPWEATVVVIEDDTRRVALVVDELVGKQEVVIKSLGERFAGVKGIAGGAILGDGRVGLILDAGGIIESYCSPKAA